MTKSAMMTVIVAPGCHVTVPHPSGIAELPPKVLAGGDAFSAAPETAVDLFAAGLILHPETGQPPPKPVAQDLSYGDLTRRAAVANGWTDTPKTGVMVSYGGGRMRAAGDEPIDLSGGIPPELPSSTEDWAPLPPPHDCTGGGSSTFEQLRGRSKSDQVFQGPVVIQQEDGRNWPSW